MTEAAKEFADVTRLKTLLFRNEQEAIAEIRGQLDAHHERIGSDAVMQRSVAGVLAGALRDARVSQHKQVADAIAPILVEGMKREIKNSRDEMVDALYPIMGRLVSAYVSSAFSEMMEQTNQRLESGLSGRFLYLRGKAALTGRSYAELVLADRQRFQIDELMLIRRGSGVLIDHLQLDLAEEMSGREPVNDSALVSGVVAAIHEFAQEAFSGRKSALRSVDMGDQTIYLRATSGLIFAVIGRGKARRKFERALDAELVTILEQRSGDIQRLEEADAASGPKILPVVADRLMAVQTEAGNRKPVLAFALFGLIATAIAGYLGWTAYEAVQMKRLRTTVTKAIATQSAFAGHPLRIDISPDRRHVRVAGFAPTAVARDALVSELGSSIGAASALETEFTVLPSIDGFEQRLVEAEGRVASAASEIRNANVRIDEAGTRIDAAAQRSALAAASAEIKQLQEENKTNREAFVSRAAALKGRIALLEEEMNSPMGQLRIWIQHRGIFFSDRTAYRNANKARATIKNLVELVRTADARIRVVGFADTRGTSASNTSLAQNRADRVTRDMVALGLGRKRIISVGRSDKWRLNATDGPQSGNRRVVFELLLDGE